MFLTFCLSYKCSTDYKIATNNLNFKNKKMKKKSERQLKVEQTLKKVVYDALNVHRVLDHIIGNINVTISQIDISPDLKNAKIYVIILANNQDSIDKMNQNAYEIQKIIAKKLKLKFTPKLHFLNDDLFYQSQNIENIIKNIDK